MKHIFEYLFSKKGSLRGAKFSLHPFDIVELKNGEIYMYLTDNDFRIIDPEHRQNLLQFDRDYNQKDILYYIVNFKGRRSWLNRRSWIYPNDYNSDFEYKNNPKYNIQYIYTKTDKHVKIDKYTKLTQKNLKSLIDMGEWKLIWER